MGSLDVYLNFPPPSLFAEGEGVEYADDTFCFRSIERGSVWRFGCTSTMIRGIQTPLYGIDISSQA